MENQNSKQGLTLREASLLSEVFEGEELEKAKKRVTGGEPIAYVMGRWFFYDLTLELDEHCLIPQPDTEHIVDYAIKLLPENAYFCDLGCGTGAIALSILKHRPDTTALLCDISNEALGFARKNAESYGLDGRCEFLLADMKKPFDGKKFDAIISNPPYIKSGDMPFLPKDVLCEPHIALDGGSDGMDFYRAIFESHKKELNSDGLFIFEIGFDEADEIISVSKENGYTKVNIYKDYGGNDRVAVCKK